MTPEKHDRLRTLLLWASLGLYFAGRVSQLYADKLPTLLIVALHVVPPALFALLHGSRLYRWKDILIFAAVCLGIAGLIEAIGLRTGFPFGRYHFTEVMGPKVFDVPIFLVLAYFGIGYCSWVVSLLVLRTDARPLAGIRVITTPLLAAFVMLAWDLSMEADWSTIDRAWIWRDGGAFFGVPLSNFAGWYLTAYLFYQAFALYCRAASAIATPLSRSFWRSAIVCYGICAGGNILLLFKPMAPPLVTDNTGRQWDTMTILATDAVISLAVMGSLALLAWLQLGSQMRCAGLSGEDRDQASA